MFHKLLSTAFLCAAVISCEFEEHDKIFKTITVPATALGNSLLGTSTTQKAMIYLPPEHDSSDLRYPVIYYLHGFSASYREIADYNDFIDQFMSDNESQQMIIVAVNGNSRYGGSFYVDSIASGNWETFISQELVDYIDENYKTLAQAQSRGICGFSMGGFGAINIGLRHPDRFSAVYCLSPGIFTENTFPAAYNSWVNYREFLLQCYGAAFSPNSSYPPYYANIPAETQLGTDTAIVNDWLNGYGNFHDKVNDYLSLDNRLNNILIECGLQDEFPWLISGCSSLSGLLKTNNIKHKFNLFEGRHGNLNGPRIRKYMLPFFAENLNFEMCNESE